MNFNEWGHLITSTNTIIDVEFYKLGSEKSLPLGSDMNETKIVCNTEWV